MLWGRVAAASPIERGILQQYRCGGHTHIVVPWIWPRFSECVRGALARPPSASYLSMMKQLLFDIGDSIILGIAVQALVLYLWFSLVVGFFASLVDLVQFFRYSSAFPGEDFSLVLLAGVLCVLMFVCSLLGALAVRKGSRRRLMIFLGVSTLCAFAVAFIPRVPLGTGKDPSLFTYLGGLGTLGVVMLAIFDPGRDPSRNPGTGRD